MLSSIVKLVKLLVFNILFEINAVISLMLSVAINCFYIHVLLIGMCGQSIAFYFRNNFSISVHNHNTDCFLTVPRRVRFLIAVDYNDQ